MVAQVSNAKLESRLLNSIIAHSGISVNQFLLILLHKVLQEGTGLNSSNIKMKFSWYPYGYPSSQMCQ